MDNNFYEISMRKLPWHYAIGFIIFWLIIYIGVAVPQGIRLPQALTIRDEIELPDSFIAERAKNMLKAITKVGPRIVGSEANEIITLEVLKAELERIKAELQPQHTLEIDTQIASGNFSISNTVFAYQSIQNFIVKLSPYKSSTPECLLLNSHFDTVPQSLGAGDDGSMVAIMLEVMRVLAKSTEPLKHSIVFLFNGAEETGWMGSHAFITQHKWAKDCRAVVNLDSAGLGGRLLLFQIAPNQFKLIEHYHKVPHPFASTFGEELFHTGLVLSNTDFQIFQKFGNLPGFDMAFIANGYVYHTKFDRFDRFPLASLQYAGDNVLALVKSLVNELEGLSDTTPNASENMIYYDLFGYVLVYYSTHFGILLNLGICIIASVAISLSALEFGINFGLSFGEVLMHLGVAMLIQVFSLILGTSIAIIVAAILNFSNNSLCWYSHKWLLMGLYFCPMFLGMLILPALTIKYIDYKCFFVAYRVKLLMHAHCVWLILITVALTIFEVRSAFLGTIAIVFYALAVFTNLSAEWKGSDHGYWFVIPIVISQIAPFTYFTSMTYTLFTFMIPIMGRSGVQFNAELLMAGIAILMSSLFAGFIMPLFLIFRNTVKIAGFFLLITFICISISFTSMGVPFRAETSVQRFEVFHEHRIAHGIDENVTNEKSLIRIKIFDRSIKNTKEFRKLFLKHEEILNALDNAECSLFNGDLNIEFLVAKPPPVPFYPKLKLIEMRALNYPPFQRRFYFEITGPNYMYASFTLKETKILDWSLAKNSTYESNEFPLQLKLVSGKHKRPLAFDITFERLSKDNEEEAYFEIHIFGQWYERQYNYVSEFRRFINAFPDYAFIDDSMTTYEKWRFQI